MKRKKISFLIICLLMVSFGFNFSSHKIQIDPNRIQFHEDFEIDKLSKDDKNTIYHQLDSIIKITHSMPSAIEYSQIKSFNQYDKFNDLLKKSNEAPIVIYLGYDSCPYCKAFVPKINQLAKERDATIHYYNTKEHINDPHFNDIMNFFKIKTVPHAFLIEDGEIVDILNAKSNMTEIEDFFEKGKFIENK